jgi:hypothetical protein
MNSWFLVSLLSGLVLAFAFSQLASEAETYELYEDCLRQLPNDVWAAERDLKVYHMTECLTRIGLDSGDGKEPFPLLRQRSKVERLGLDPDRYYLHFPPICHLGSSTKGEVLTHHWTPPWTNCSMRSFGERTGMKTLFVLKDVVVRRQGYGPQAFAADLFEAMRHYNLSEISIIGDSVSQQLDMFLLCDALRDGVLIRKKGVGQKPSGESFKYGYEFELSDGFVINIWYTQVYGPATSDFESPRAEADNYVSFLETLQRSIPDHKRGVVVFNMGLHIAKFPDRAVSGYPPMARALLDYAKDHPGNAVLFRETTAQHFAYSQDGSYSENTTFNSTDFCCNRNAATPQHFLTDPAWEAALRGVDREWRRVVGWVPVHNATSALFDSHMEVGRFQAADCTHYAYAPNAWAPLWHGVRTELDRLMRQPRR